MADSFWKSLGSTLVETGTAYLQQVRFVNELRQLSPDDARARFTQYVQGLSSAARAGFAVTLTALANSERSAEAKRFIESLRTALANPNVTAPPASSLHSDSTPPASTPPLSSFDDDLQRTAGWYDLDDDARSAAVTDHLNALDVTGLNALRTNLEQMQQNCAVNIQNHRDNEARIAAGRFIEDQMSYNMAVLRTGQHDPDWVRQLRELEEWGRRFETLHGIVGLALERHAARAAPQTPPEEPDALTSVNAMRQLLEQQLQSGEVRGERAVAYRRLLDKIGTVMVAAERKEIEPEQVVIRVKQLYADAAPMLANPGAAARTTAGSPRLRELDGYAGAIKTAIGRELMESPGSATTEALGAILGDLSTFQQQVAGLTDEALTQLESSVLRAAARAHHELTTTRHALIARPVWESFDYLPAVNAVAYSGAADLQQQLEAALSERQLSVLNSKRLQNRGQLRWDELNSCHVAVFDLRGAGEMATLVTTSPKRARELATAAYELGLAFALGKPVVVVAAGDERLPFDIDLSPVTLDGDDDEALLQQAIDEAFYVPQRRGDHTSIAESIAFLDSLTVGHEKRRTFEGMGWLDVTLARDPVGFAAATAQLLPMLGAPPWRLLRPAWPAAYPGAAEKRCFHVMPFGPSWANEARDVARTFCEERGFVYRRGDEAEDGRIMHAIWDDLCRAHVVLVDVTGANLNVMIELGMAHAIGRPLLAVRRSDAVDVRPKNIEKLRVLRYESPTDLMALLLTKWPT
jgi:nucleoside 2-deoxyribosyltransferase